MKRFVLMLAIVGVAFTACDKKEEPYRFRGTETIYLNGVEQPKFKSTMTQYTIAEIVRHPKTTILYTSECGGAELDFYRLFAKEWRDTINNRLLMQASDILTNDGELVYGFISAYDVHLQLLDGDNLRRVGDTCGYIPQSVIDSARVQIEELYTQERYDEIYELFHNAFTFYPCTGDEYKQLVLQGVQGRMAQATLQAWMEFKATGSSYTYNDWYSNIWKQSEEYEQIRAEIRN